MKKGITYHVTGILMSGRRFKCIETTNRMHAMGINLWCGSVWSVTNGKRKLLRRTYN